MLYKCLIVDDEELARRLLVNHLSQLENFEVVAVCESAIAASKVLKEQAVDLLFLDIEMPILTGVDFFKNLIKKPKVIFTTAYRDFAVEGFELDAVDYLLKPITFARFFKAIEKFENLQKPNTPNALSKPTQDDFIFIRKNRKQVKVSFDTILFVESLKDYIKIHTKEGNHTIKYSITSFHELLDERFLRTHRSYLVNRDKITAYTAQDVEIEAIEIPVGESYRKHIQVLLGGN
ncbi:LytTR family DNA-binding domain-containing protein [Aureisphaera galaxeae]|uniref:LytR/AlgR family response regulator transcription factor n=1 Tax=Aureisphaera galaxeae TaxID=1538023 RepID=UPI00235082EB|nr:LytTR family DNA-binding domain-containing protein [Aureisphaera galaxeae]MDC8004256.1 LytTR family DNA-binding domain-containing protein [Aureisphaera galaxeae]